MITVEVHPPQGKRWDRRGLLFDATAREMAAMRVDEGEQGTRIRLDDPATAAIYRASHNSKPAQAGQHMEG